MYQQHWGYRDEDKLYLGVREQKRLNTTGLGHRHKRGTRADLYLSRTDSTDTSVP
jgi:hypothetical protein